jgi:hypothetical protein
VGDGRTIFFTERRKDGKARTFVQDFAGGGAPRPALPEGVWLGRNNFSPDGRLAAALCPKGEGVCIFPVGGGGEPKPVPGLEKGAGAVGWDDAGRLYVRRAGSFPSEQVSRVDPTTGRAEPWAELRPPDTAGVVGMGRIMVARSGDAVAYSYARRLADLYVVEGVR